MGIYTDHKNIEIACPYFVLVGNAILYSQDEIHLSYIDVESDIRPMLWTNIKSIFDKEQVFKITTMGHTYLVLITQFSEYDITFTLTESASHPSFANTLPTQIQHQ